MSSSWFALHAQLRQSSLRLSFRREYVLIAAQAASLRPHADPEALLTYLQRREGDPEAKNICLRALLTAASGPQAEVATTLLIIALWPGLDAVRGRLARYFRSDPATLEAELLGRLAFGIRTADPVRVTRVAATLLRNTERDLRRALMREATERAEVEDVVRDTQPSCHVPSTEREAGTDDLVRALGERLGRDAELVLLVAVDRLSQREAAHHLGISHDAARKRYQRALYRLKATQMR